MKINKIVKLKNNKYKIYTDYDNIVTYDDIILKYNILYKKELNDEELNNIIKDTKKYDDYNDAIKYISKKRRSEYEIKKYLLEKKPSIDIDIAMNKLKCLGLIDDIGYCAAYINDKLLFSNDSINKIKNHLLTQNISEEIIEEELNKCDKELIKNKLDKIIIKKIKSNKKSSNKLLKQKIMFDMINLGYDREDINLIIDKYMIDDINILEKEYNKLYLKLKSKYEGFELKNKIKERLLLKGFSIDKINEVIKKVED